LIVNNRFPISEIHGFTVRTITRLFSKQTFLRERHSGDALRIVYEMPRLMDRTCFSMAKHPSLAKL